MHKISPKRLQFHNLIIFVLLFAALGVYLLTRSYAVTPNITIDYSNETNVHPFALAMDETGYQTPNVIANDSTEVQRFKTLSTTYMRMHLAWSTPGNPSSQIICGGSGCDTSPTGDQWISSIKQTGAVPVVVVNESGASDAANMVRHFNVNTSTGKIDSTLPNYVKYWLIGNEPDLNSISVSTYSNDFNADNDAMKTVDPNIKIGGPTTAWLDDPFIPTFIQNSGGRVDFIDFHGYPSVASYTYAGFFNWASGTGDGITKVKGWLNQYVPARASQIFIEVGEWSMDPGSLYTTYGPNGRNLTKSQFNVVWGADVIGQIVKNGGVAMHYGTKGNVVAWTSGTRVDYDTGQSINMTLDDPMAPYHAYGMWTGEGLFRGFGTKLATSSTTLPNVDVFASDNQKNIVVVNKDTANAQSGIFQLNGVSSGTVDVWQHKPGMLFNQPPVHVGSGALSNGSFSYSIPALSATTFVVTPASSSPPTVTLSVSPPAINSGGSSTLTWSSTNATSCTASGGWGGSQATSGSQSVTPTATTAFSLTCTGTSGSASASATVTVNAASVLGDCNGDGHVTITDLSILLSNYSKAYAPCDFNADGIVNILDLSTLLSNYGS
jgi:Glycosyl hydrolases family 39/Dockerin type I domain